MPGLHFAFTSQNRGTGANPTMRSAWYAYELHWVTTRYEAVRTKGPTVNLHLRVAKAAPWIHFN